VVLGDPHFADERGVDQIGRERAVGVEVRARGCADPQRKDILHMVLLRVREPYGVADAIECKWSPKAFDAKSLFAFRAVHPKGRNFVVVPAIARRYGRRIGDAEVTFIGLDELMREV
jgi:hypothetical protein